MCGISGYIIGNKKINHTSIKSTLNLMKRRGPDNQGFFQNIEYKKKITLLHSRLSIIDLNHRSNQPFTIGQYTLIFNGIIYNYIELRKKLKKKITYLKQTLIRKFYYSLTLNMEKNA